MKTITDEWFQDGIEFARTYTEHQIRCELDDIWGSEEYRDGEDGIHDRAEHLEELLKELEAAEWNSSIHFT